MKNKILLLFVLIITISCEDNDLTSSQNNAFDVYTTGENLSGNASYWNNDLQLILNNDIFSITRGMKIFNTNNNTYVWGIGWNEGNDNPNPNPNFGYLLWINEQATDLSPILSDTDFHLFRIFDFYVKNDDIYFLGSQRSISNPDEYQIAYWKNGIKTTIINNPVTSFGSVIGSGHGRIVVNDNDDVYSYYSFGVPDGGTNGVFLNGVQLFNPLDSGFLISDMEINNNNEVYLCGLLFNTSSNILPNPNGNGFYHNVNTGTTTYTPYRIERLSADQNNIYALARSNDDTYGFQTKIYQNNTLFYETTEGFRISDFKIVDNKLYLIEQGDFLNIDPNEEVNTAIETFTADNVPLVTQNALYTLKDFYINQN